MQQYKKLSRGPMIDTEQCVANVGANRFDLVLIAAARSREISRKHKADELGTQVNAPVSALLDVQNGLVGREYLKKVRDSAPAKRAERFH
jgi:DNA-directed RNA polymerase subunit K/omega